MEIQATVVFEKNLDAINSNTRYIENIGGSRSSKTYSLCQVLIVYLLQNNGKTVSIIRKSFPALRASVMRDFFEILKSMKLYNVRNHNKTENLYTFDNGSVVEFFSADDEQKLRGRKRDIAWCNEANELYYDDFQQIALRTSEKIIVDYNPSDGDSYLYYLPVDKTVSIHSTYKDNPFLSKTLIDEIEGYKFTDEDYYTIFALGKRAFSKENVYKKFDVLDHCPEYLDKYIYAIDYGYQHPTCLLKLWYCSTNNNIYVEELIYESYLTSTDIIDKMNALEVDKTVPIVSETARPEIIADIRRSGYSVVEAIKDVKDGINAVKTRHILLAAKALNVIKENENYKYKKVNGKVTEEVIKLWDDAMDALRYGVMYIKKYLGPQTNVQQVYTFEF